MKKLIDQIKIWKQLVSVSIEENQGHEARLQRRIALFRN